MTIPNEISRLLGQVRSAFLVAHVMPDGDTIGSVLGLSWALRKMGISTTLACSDPVPREFAFMPGVQEIGRHSLSTEDVVIAVDTSDVQRLGEVCAPGVCEGVPLIVIDHHITNTLFGTHNYVLERSSTAELVLDVLQRLGAGVDETIATCLLTGLVTDTQGFRTTATTVESMKAAVTLMEAGGDLHLITASVFKQRPVDSLRVWGAALAAARYSEGVLWTEISRQVLQRNGASDEMVSGLANFMSSVSEAKVAVVFHERDEHQVEVGLRSVPGIDVSRIAFSLGGGGHQRAAGCTLAGEFSEVVNRVLSAVHAAVREAH